MKRLTTPDGNVHEGQVRGGKPHGQGRMTFRDGGVYEGEFRSGRPHGLGKATAPDGGEYRGDFAEGEMSGRGRMAHPDGRIEEGVFDDGRLVSGQATPPKPGGAPVEEERHEWKPACSPAGARSSPLVPPPPRVARS